MSGKNPKRKRFAYFDFDLRVLIKAFCRSVARFMTSVYTRFFSPDEALRMNSENRVETIGFGLNRVNIVCL